MRPSTVVGRFVLTAALLGLALPAPADTFVLPHLLEVSGRAALDRSPGSSDTIVHALLASIPGSPAAGNSVQVYAHDADGSLITNAVGTPVCGPCDFDLGTSSDVRMSLIELIVAAGIADVNPGGGYLVIETAGPDSSSIDVTIENELYLPGGNTVSTLMPLHVPCGGGSGGLPTGKRIRVVPSFDEMRGSHLASPYTDDATLSIAYTGDHPDSDQAPGATVDVYLFDASTVEPLTYGTGEPICSPCTFPMGGMRAPRQQTVSIDEILYGSAQGVYPIDRAKMLMVLDTAGDADAVTVQCVMARSGSTTGDLSVSIVEPRDIEAPATATAAEVARRFAGVRSQPNPFNPQTTLRFTLDRAEDVVLQIVDLRGRVVRTLDTSRLPAGEHAVAWDGRDDEGRVMASGVYLARLQTSAFTSVEKMTLLK